MIRQASILQLCTAPQLATQTRHQRVSIKIHGDFTLQALIMGATAMAVAAVTDSPYALLASRAGTALSRRRLRVLTRTSGGLLIGGGVWMALARAK